MRTARQGRLSRMMAKAGTGDIPLRVRLSGSGVASYLIRRGFMASSSNWRGASAALRRG
jgi:hypothetical protein